MILKTLLPARIRVSRVSASSLLVSCLSEEDYGVGNQLNGLPRAKFRAGFLCEQGMNCTAVGEQKR